VADHHGDVVDRGGIGAIVGVEQQVSKTNLRGAHVLVVLVKPLPLPGGAHPLPVQAGVLPGPPDQPRAVVGVGAFGAPLVELALLGERERYRPRRHL
jgi:hypothetical protein